MKKFWERWNHWWSRKTGPTQYPGEECLEFLRLEHLADNSHPRCLGERREEEGRILYFREKANDPIIKMMVNDR